MALLNFNARNVEPQQDQSPLPAGHYVASIIDSEFKPTKRNDGQYLELTYAVQEGQYKGRKLWVRLNLDNPNQQAVSIAMRQLSSICHAVGLLDVPDSTRLHNRPHQIRVEYVKADGIKSQRDSNEIKDWKSITTSAPQGAAQPAPAATADETPPWLRQAG